MSGEQHINIKELQVEEYDEADSSKSEDTQRMEEKWSEKNESFFRKIKEDCLHQANVHSIISHRNKKRYMMASIPTTIIPLILVNIDIFSPQKEIQMIGLTLCSIINGCNSLLNFSKKCEVHNAFAGRYSDLASEVDKILIRKKKFRQPFDVLLERITTKKRYIDDTAPYV